MRFRLPVIVASLLVVPVAATAAQLPHGHHVYRTKGDGTGVYISVTQPNYIGKIVVSCAGPVAIGGQSADYSGLPMKRGSFHYDRVSKLTIAPGGGRFIVANRRVVVTGTFVHGQFTGFLGIKGTSCWRVPYTTGR